MMENLARIAATRPIATLVLATLVMILGLMSWRQLPLDIFPDLQSPTILVAVSSGDRPAQEMERIYGERIEQLLFTVKGLTALEQTARSGRLITRVSFDWDSDIDIALVEVNRAVASISADVNVDEVKVRRFDPRQLPIVILGLTATDKTIDLAELRTLAKRQLAPNLEQLAGVAEVRVTGGKVKQAQVQLDPVRLKAHELTVNAVAERIRGNNIDYNAGTLEQDDKVLLVRGLARFVDTQDIEQVVVKYVENDDLISAVKVSDIAKVVMKDAPIKSLVRVNGELGVGLSIYKESGANTVEVSQTVNSALAELSASMPGLKLSPIGDEAALVEDAIGEVKSAAGVGVILAISVLVLFLRSAGPIVIVVVAVPVSLLATVFAMDIAGHSLNLMTLGGLALGTGMLVDNAIVVIESIFRRRALGDQPLEAAAKGTGIVGGAIISSTLTTCVVFLPIVFIAGMASKLVAGIAFTVVICLLASLLVALFIIPALSVFLLPNKAVAQLDVGDSKLEGVVKSLLLRPWLVLAAVAVLIAIAALFLSRLGTELVPPGDPRQFTMRVETTAGQQVESTAATVAQIESIVEQAAGAGLIGMLAEVGKLDDDERVIQEQHTAEHIAKVQVRLSAAEGEGKTATQVINSSIAAVESLYGANVDWQVDGNAISAAIGAGSEGIVVEVSGNALGDIRYGAEQIQAKLAQLPQLWNVQTSFEGAPPELHLNLKRTIADGMGITLEHLRNVIAAALDGHKVTDFIIGDETKDVVLTLPQVDADTLGQMIFNAPNGLLVKVADVASISYQPGAREILRRDQRRIAQVSGLISPDSDNPRARAAVLAALAEVQLPAGIMATLAGEEQQRIETVSQLQWAGLLALMLVLMVLAASFESLIHPLTILMAIPLSIIGVAAVLVPLGQPVGIMAMLGFIVLVGIAVNNAILLIQTARGLMTQGADVIDALAKAAGMRLRPIIMTTATTVLALLPLALGGGEGAQLRSPLAWTVVGGLLSATLGCLLAIPCIYLLLDKLSAKPRV